MKISNVCCYRCRLLVLSVINHGPGVNENFLNFVVFVVRFFYRGRVRGVQGDFIFLVTVTFHSLVPLLLFLLLLKPPFEDSETQKQKSKLKSFFSSFMDLLSMFQFWPKQAMFSFSSMALRTVILSCC